MCKSIHYAMHFKLRQCFDLNKTKRKNRIYIKILMNHELCSITYSSQDMETTKVSPDKWIKKMCHTDTLRNIIKSQKRKKILPLVTTWMGFRGIVLSEKSQAEKNTTISHMES